MDSLSNHIEASSHVYSSGDKLLHLLDLPLESKILIIGDALEPWSAAFKNVCFSRFFTALPPNIGIFNLVLYHSGCASSIEELRTQLKALKVLTPDHGVLLFFGENFLSFTRIKSFLLRRELRSKNYLRCGRKSYRENLIYAGFSPMHVFLPMPSLVNLEELIPIGSKHLQIPHAWHPLVHLAHYFNSFHLVANGYVFVCASKSLEQGLLFISVAKQLDALKNSKPGFFSLKRLDMRVRGAMVLFVEDKSNNLNLIFRVVSDPRTHAIVSRNQEFLSELRDLSKLSTPLKSVIPIPFGAVEEKGSTIFIETMMPGTIAWKVNGRRLKKRICYESIEFLLELNKTTRRRVYLDDLELDQILNINLSWLKSMEGVSLELVNDLEIVVAKTRALLLGQEIFLTPAHGDYGYGNILVDPSNGQLTGVIDWDTGRLWDLAGVDLLNFEFQRIKIENNYDFFDAFSNVARTALSKSLECMGGLQWTEFGIDRSLIPAILSIALLRYLARSAQYSEFFSTEQNDWRLALNYLNKTILVSFPVK